MKKNDLILIGSLFIIAILGYFGMELFINNSSIANGSAIVMYNDQEILEIFLVDGTYTIKEAAHVIDVQENIFTVEGTNGDVVIEYGTSGVRVIEETSPQHICKIQGWSNTPLRPITCLPNNLVILIQGPKDPSLPDDVSS